MDERSHTRRRLLRATATLGGVATIGALAGCFGDDGSAAGGRALETVPEGAHVALEADVADVLDAEPLRRFYRQSVASSPVPGPASFEAYLDQFETNTGLDPRAIDSTVVFGTAGEQGQRTDLAAVLETGWSDEAVRGTVTDWRSPTREHTHEGVAIYEYNAGGGPAAVATPGEGRVVAGTAPAVREAIDVVSGAAESVDGRLREDFTATAADSYVRFAFVVPESIRSVTGETTVGGVALPSITGGRGAVRRTEEAPLHLRLETIGEDTARRLEKVIETWIERARSSLDGRPAREPDPVSNVVQILDGATVERRGSAVVVSATGGLVVVLTAVGSVLATFVLGLGATGGTPTPQASFQWAYESDGRLTITHEAGEAIAATSLFVRGEADGGETGRWDQLGGEASGQVGTDPAVTAGDALRLQDVGPAFELDLVYVPSDPSDSAVLDADAGPAA